MGRGWLRGRATPLKSARGTDPNPDMRTRAHASRTPVLGGAVAFRRAVSTALAPCAASCSFPPVSFAPARSRSTFSSPCCAFSRSRLISSRCVNERRSFSSSKSFLVCSLSVTELFAICTHPIVARCLRSPTRPSHACLFLSPFFSRSVSQSLQHRYRLCAFPALRSHPQHPPASVPATVPAMVPATVYTVESPNMM